MPLHNPKSQSIVGSGPPTSGPGGTLGDTGGIYLDSNQMPKVPYLNLSTDPTSPSWISLRTGVTT